LQRLADEIKIPIHISHLPPGTSKWNKIEHRLFSYISMNWRGQPLISHEVIVNLIAGTTTRKGLKIYAELDDSSYPSGIKISDAEFESIRITRDEFHGANEITGLILISAEMLYKLFNGSLASFSASM